MTSPDDDLLPTQRAAALAFALLVRAGAAALVVLGLYALSSVGELRRVRSQPVDRDAAPVAVQLGRRGRRGRRRPAPPAPRRGGDPAAARADGLGLERGEARRAQGADRAQLLAAWGGLDRRRPLRGGLRGAPAARGRLALRRRHGRGARRGGGRPLRRAPRRARPAAGGGPPPRRLPPPAARRGALRLRGRHAPGPRRGGARRRLLVRRGGVRLGDGQGGRRQGRLGRTSPADRQAGARARRPRLRSGGAERHVREDEGGHAHVRGRAPPRGEHAGSRRAGERGRGGRGSRRPREPARRPGPGPAGGRDRSGPPQDHP